MLFRRFNFTLQRFLCAPWSSSDHHNQHQRTSCNINVMSAWNIILDEGLENRGAAEGSGVLRCLQYFHLLKDAFVGLRLIDMMGGGYFTGSILKDS